MGQATLRKEAGFALGAVAMEYEDEAFFKSQAKLEACLSSDNWQIRYFYIGKRSKCLEKQEY